MAVHPIQNHGISLLSLRWRETLLHWLAWSLLVAGLFYAMHRYFEYRDHELDKRLEQMRVL